MPHILPSKCLRNRGDCMPLSQIEADDHSTFLCCGENDGSHRSVNQDKYTLCIKSCEGIDDIRNCDKRDLIHQASIIMGALAIIEDGDCSEYHKKDGAGDENKT